MNTIVCERREVPITSCAAHNHKHWEIILHLTGNAIGQVDKQEYNLSAGTITVIPPYTTHSNFSDEPYTDMYLQAKDLDMLETVVVYDTDNHILMLMNMLHKILTEKELHYDTIADHITTLISSYIRKLSQTDLGFQFIHDLKNQIYDNISNPDFSLMNEIQKTGYNPDYLRRCFKKVMGRPPLEYLIMLRIERAKILLTQHSFTSIIDTAHACGFSDNYYFSTCFKKHTGIAPLQYRKSKISSDQT